jgi:hypothetical protein
MTELERLQKEINGKVVVYFDSETGIKLSAIMLWPPDGGQVSVKPYGHSPKELLAAVENAGIDGWDIEDFKKPEFCFASLRVGGDVFDILAPMMAQIEEEGIYDTEKFASAVAKENKGIDFVGPSCPYG